MKEHLGIIDPEFALHALRNTSATRLISLGRDIRVIQVFMGHSRIETTLRYAHVSAKNISSCVM
ncbi:MAG: tyrosine-type recombinase/integrase [Paracoccaceae bacterium]